MRVFKFSFLFIIAALFITACNKNQVADQVYNQPYEIGRVQEGFLDDDELIARENLDLQAIGGIMERANNAEDFEYLLNSENGINNLDLNDDGYADYISVREFDDRYDDERGFSLFSMFGPDLIQEIATIIFNRNGYNNGYNNGYYYPGSRVLIRGNEYLYGDDYYYETDWMNRQVPYVSWAFSDRDNYYQSPYYYGYYPSYYEPYQVVETPVYQSRIEQYYYSPVFVQTTQPTITEIRVVSPLQEVSMSQAYLKIPKEQRVERQQKIMMERNTQTAQFDREKPGRVKDFSGREDKQFNENPNRFEKDNQNRVEKQEKFQNDRPQQMREKPDKQERFEQRQQNNQQKFERPQQQQQKFERQQQKQVERQQQKQFERPQQQKQVERQQQIRVDKPQQQMKQQQRQENRVQPNNGGGNPNKGGGGNPNKGGGGGGKKGKP